VANGNCDYSITQLKWLRVVGLLYY